MCAWIFASPIYINVTYAEISATSEHNLRTRHEITETVENCSNPNLWKRFGSPQTQQVFDSLRDAAAKLAYIREKKIKTGLLYTVLHPSFRATDDIT